MGWVKGFWESSGLCLVDESDMTQDTQKIQDIVVKGLIDDVAQIKAELRQVKERLDNLEQVATPDQPPSDD